MENRVLEIYIEHEFHEKYYDKSVPPAVIKFIQDRMASTPRQIFQDLQFDELKASEGANITQKQIHYWWSQGSSAVWRQDDDAFTWALTYLQDPIRSDILNSKVVQIGEKLRALAFYILPSIQSLASSVKELCIDSTYGTNNEKAELFAVLAEVDGTGIVLFFLFFLNGLMISLSFLSFQGFR